MPALREDPQGRDRAQRSLPGLRPASHSASAVPQLRPDPVGGYRDADGHPWCDGCRRQTQGEPCSGCGALKVVCARDHNGPWCRACWETVRPSPPCTDCGQRPSMPTPSVDGVARCVSCYLAAQVPCARCGTITRAERHWRPRAPPGRLVPGRAGRSVLRPLPRPVRVDPGQPRRRTVPRCLARTRRECPTSPRHRALRRGRELSRRTVRGPRSGERASGRRGWSGRFRGSSPRGPCCRRSRVAPR